MLDRANVAENGLIIMLACTIRAIMEYIKKGTIHVASILLHYTCGCFVGFIAYKSLPFSDMKGLYIGALVLLSSDIVVWIISKDGFTKIKDLLLQAIK